MYIFEYYSAIYSNKVESLLVIGSSSSCFIIVLWFKNVTTSTGSTIQLIQVRYDWWELNTVTCKIWTRSPKQESFPCPLQLSEIL